MSLRRMRALQRRSADQLTITGLLEGERVVWLRLLEDFRERPVVSPVLAFLTFDGQPLEYAEISAGPTSSAELVARRTELRADAVLYGGSRRIDEHKARLSLYTYWHSARGRRIKVAERVDGVVREVDMKAAKDLSSWVEDLF